MREKYLVIACYALRIGYEFLLETRQNKQNFKVKEYMTKLC